MTLFRSILLVSLSAAGLVQAADEAADVEAKLRESLRATMLQLRDVQGQVANLQAAQIAADNKVKDLEGQVQTLTKQSADDRAVSAKTISELQAQLFGRDDELAQLRPVIERWKKAHTEAVVAARATEVKRAKWENDAILLQRKVEDQQRKNAAMFKLGNEILVRYEKFSLGDALTAREPFVGITRTKFQTLIQDYSDQLADQKIKP